MVTKVHESFDAGQFLTGSLTHFDITHADLVALPAESDPAFAAAKVAQDAAKKHLVETVGTRATVVILGANGARIAVENNGAWEDAAALEAALGAGYTVAAFDY